MIRSSTYTECARFKSAAAREQTSINDSRNTEWFAVDVGGEVVGCAALLIMGSGRRFKAHYVHPDHRGQGWGSALLDHALGVAERDCASYVVALARDPEPYLRRGFKRHGHEQPNGVVPVRKLL